MAGIFGKPDRKMLTATAAADRLGITPAQVRQLVRNGHLDDVHDGNKRRVWAAQVDKLAAKGNVRDLLAW